MGLDLVEAIYWGKPVLTIEDKGHGPEIGYLVVAAINPATYSKWTSHILHLLNGTLFMTHYTSEWS